MKLLKHTLIIALLTLTSCDNTVRDITGGANNQSPTPTPEVKPFNINTDGFDFLAKMQGHWVGTNRVIADDYAWFGWDYRAISPSHLHGIHEGGSLGNLLTSFFVTNYKNTRTLMARNGGLLNGIYRTSYFVLDKVEDRNQDGKYYRFVDAVGGTGIMYFELRFKDNELFFNSYTSNLGNRVPTRHMTFKGTKQHPELAAAAAQATGFPKNEIDTGLDFANGFNENNLYVEKTGDKPKSATFLSQNSANDVYELAPLSGDPYTIINHPYLGTLTVQLTRGTAIKDSNLLVYLSRDPLTDNSGYFSSVAGAFDTLLHFPELENKENSLLFTYLHPGTYYVTVIADMNKDGSPNTGDISSISQRVTIGVEENKTVTVNTINVQN